MARGVNKFIGIGNCCADPETRSFPDGGQVCNLTIACNDSYKNKQTGENVDTTEFVRVVFRNRLAEIAAQYLKKGSKVYIEGSLRTRKWTNQQGQDQYTTEIMANQMQMLDSRNDGQAPAPQQGGYQQPAPQQQAPQQMPQQQAPHQFQPGYGGQQPAPQAQVGGFDDFDDPIPFSNYEYQYI